MKCLIYCTKGKTELYSTDKGYVLTDFGLGEYYKNKFLLNGKIVAEFDCDKVEKHIPFLHWCIGKETCLTRDEVLDYLDRKDTFVGNPKRQGKMKIAVVCDARNRQYFVSLLQEIEKVLDKVEAKHLNSHVHVHGIPKIFELTCKLAKEYNINYIRTQFEMPYLLPDIKKYLKLADNDTYIFLCKLIFT